MLKIKHEYIKQVLVFFMTEGIETKFCDYRTVLNKQTQIITTGKTFKDKTSSNYN